MMRVKRNDTVLVLKGKDKGKRGTVIEVLPECGKVKVQAIGMVTKHVKAKKQGDVAGIRKEESYISLSNVMPIAPSSNKPCRVNTKVLDDGTRVRISNSSQEIF
jgi:large subunit ribosomal protein L24